MFEQYFLVFGLTASICIIIHLFFDIKKTIWKNKCNDTTYAQRKEILPSSAHLPHDLFMKKMSMFNKVSYDEHYQTLVNKECPYELYDKKLFEPFQQFKVYKEKNQSGIVVFYYYNKNNKKVVHNEDGPAIIFTDGTKKWWVNDKDVTDYVEQWLEERNLYSDNMSEEDKMALSFFMRSL